MFGKEKYSKEAFEEAQNTEQNAEAVAKEKKEQLLDQAYWGRQNALETYESASGIGGPFGAMARTMNMTEADKGARKQEKKARKITPESVRKEARRKLDALMKAGHSEAIKLNEEYDELSDRVAKLYGEALQAQEELEKFEHDKLGMTVPDEASE
jgi:hypothetical protein